MAGAPDLTSVVASERLPEGLQPDDEPDTIGVALREAEAWLRSFKWCQDIKRALLGSRISTSGGCLSFRDRAVWT